MSPVGHSLTGLAIGYVALPNNLSVRAKALSLVAFVVLANAPDLPFPGWGHDRYDISHSVFSTTVGVVLCVLLAVFYSKLAHKIPGRLIAAGAVAWYSHLLLDTFYNHGNGLAVFWPISDGRVALPIACFNTLQIPPLVSAHNLQVGMIEGLVYGPLLAATIAWKTQLSTKALAQPPEGTNK